MTIASLNGARLAFDDSGAPPAPRSADRSDPAGQPAGIPLVLIHAGIADRTMWDVQVAAFAPAHRVVRLDQRGFGESDAPPEPFSPSEDVRALLDHLAIDRAVVVGISMGGNAALELALAHPGRVAGLVLCSTRAGATAEPGEDLRAIWKSADAAYDAGDIDRATEIETAAWVDGKRRPPGTLAPEVRAKAVAMIRRTWDRAAAGDEPGEEIELDPPRQTRLGEIACPTLLLRGDLDLPDITTSVDALIAGIPGGAFVLISNAAHLPPLEQPAAFNAALRDWLATLALATSIPRAPASWSTAFDEATPVVGERPVRSRDDRPTRSW